MNWTFTRIGPHRHAAPLFRDCEHPSIPGDDPDRYGCGVWTDDEEEVNPVECDAPWAEQTYYWTFILEATRPDHPQVEMQSFDSGLGGTDPDSVWAAAEAVFARRLEKKYGAPPA